MGDAFTAVADDAYTLFYNPAAMGRHRGITIAPINPSLESPDVLNKKIGFSGFDFGIDDRFDNWPNDAAGISDRILGFPIYAKLSAAPAIKVQHFGLSLFAISKTNMVLENYVHPSLEVDYRLDRGFIMGYAFNLGRGKTTGANRNGIMNSLGVSIKSVNRQGLEGRYNLFGTNLLNIVGNSDNYKEIRKNLGYSKGSGFGFDLGYEFNMMAGGTTTTFGTSFLDVGDTKYGLDEGTEPIPDQDSSLNFGFAFSQKLASLIEYTLAADYHNAISDADFASKLHFGARLKVPFFRFMAGWNGGYTSFGLSTELLFARLTIGFYGIELGQQFKQREGKRMIITLNLLEVSFDKI
jgi:hypothetical protein